MRIVIQKVSEARVKIEEKIVGEIEQGLVLLVGIHHDDTEQELEWMVNKVLKLRVFEDSDGKMNRSVSDVAGGILVISQFTLYGDAKKGTRPSYIEAARPEVAEPLYRKMIQRLEEKSSLLIQSGTFGADMDVELINDGPVTILLEK